jgi:hypothetical protein
MIVYNFQYETYSFLPRLTGSASDNVNISPSLLSELLGSDMAENMVSCLLSMGGQRLTAVKRYGTQGSVHQLRCGNRCQHFSPSRKTSAYATEQPSSKVKEWLRFPMGCLQGNKEGKL